MADDDQIVELDLEDAEKVTGGLLQSLASGSHADSDGVHICPPPRPHLS
jgi:hypothetical protein